MSASKTRRAGVAWPVTRGARRTSAAVMANTSRGKAASLPAATAAADAAESTERTVEKTKHDLAGLVEEAAAGMRQLMAAAPGSGTDGTPAQDPQQAMSRLFEGAMATNKRFADALLDRAEPGPAVELQRRFVGEYFDALAQGGSLLLRAAAEAAGQSSERRTRRRGGQEAGGAESPAARSEPAPTDRARSPRPPAPHQNGNPAPGKAAE
jgi:hypothetical protein